MTKPDNVYIASIRYRGIGDGYPSHTAIVTWRDARGDTTVLQYTEEDDLAEIAEILREQVAANA
jgi:hypothetical protein